MQRRATRRPRRRRGLWGWLWRIALVMALAPVLWVALYRVMPIPVTFLMVQRVVEGEGLERHSLRIDAISPNLRRAVIAGEDANFCAHDGFEWEAIEQAWRANQAGRPLRGASTLSQQTAKNVFLWPQRSWVRKGFEAGFTVLIETLWPKRRILEAYLNVAEWGPGIYGAEAAAQHYFGKSARSLTPREAARLAAILPSPRRWSASEPNRRVLRRAQRIERNARLVRAQGLDSCLARGEVFSWPDLTPKT